MDKIQLKILNSADIKLAEEYAVALARLTQHGESITSIEDFEKLLAKEYSINLVDSLISMPHPTLQKFFAINVIIVGASRRFLAQMTRHQNEVKFMSASLQYSNYTGKAQFCTPYEIMETDRLWRNANPQLTDTEIAMKSPSKIYDASCAESLRVYEKLVPIVGRDAAGYAMPQGLRNVLFISATVFQWKHMISQRICHRNTLETQYVMLRIWEEMLKHSELFSNCGPSCIRDGRCDEGKMSCGKFLHSSLVDDYICQHNCSLPTAILDTKFKEIR